MDTGTRKPKIQGENLTRNREERKQYSNLTQTQLLLPKQFWYLNLTFATRTHHYPKLTQSQYTHTHVQNFFPAKYKVEVALFLNQSTGMQLRKMRPICSSLCSLQLYSKRFASLFSQTFLIFRILKHMFAIQKSSILHQAQQVYIEFIY